MGEYKRIRVWKSIREVKVFFLPVSAALAMAEHTVNLLTQKGVYGTVVRGDVLDPGF